MRWNEILSESNSWTYLYWFWFNPSINRLVHVEGTHATIAAYELGFKPDNYSSETESEMDLEDEEVIGKAISAGWVRGRYGNRRNSEFGGMTWNASYDLDDRKASYELSLQGQPSDVLATARIICQRRRVSDLYLDFTTGAKMESVHLSGIEKEIYLETGKLP